MSLGGREQQLSVFGDVVSRADVCWLGMCISHRRLFEGLESGWLQPESAGFLLGSRRFPAQGDGPRPRHAILVGVKLDVSMLPAWSGSPAWSEVPENVRLRWHGSVPTFAISAMFVETEEERSRLKGLARATSNVELPAVPLSVLGEDGPFSVARPTSSATSGPADALRDVKVVESPIVPPEADSVLGSMCMAVWALPRIDPWFDLLVAMLSSGEKGLEGAALDVEAPWWRFPPWAGPRPRGFQPGGPEALWLAAVEVFGSRTPGRVRPDEVAREIARSALDRGWSSVASERWLRCTRDLLTARTVIQPSERPSAAVETAVQLVLLRPQPRSFKTWPKDVPDLPPSVVWSGAALCGMYRGYSGLEKEFRASTEWPYIATRALRACSGEEDVRWPFVGGEPRWSRESDSFVLFWGEKRVRSLRTGARGRWYGADYRDPDVARCAKSLTARRDWPCLLTSVTVPGRSSVGLVGTVTVRREQQLETDGQVTFTFPATTSVRRDLDVDAFRHHVAVAGGTLNEPPPSAPPLVRRAVLEPPGLVYVPDFITSLEEEETVSRIDRAEWMTDLSRRVQQYGWPYDYRARRVDGGSRLGDLPEWLAKLARRLKSQGLVSTLPDQVIVNEYCGSQGISAHVDQSSSFGDSVAMISLLESWEMWFRERGTKRKVTQMLRHRSAAVISGRARYDWTHEIPRRKTEPASDGSRVTRGRRLSLTFRKVR